MNDLLLGSEHKNKTLYSRYHKDIYMPEAVLKAAEHFLPHAGEPLPLSVHYHKVRAARKLPKSIYMPYAYHIIDVTVFKAANAVFRVLVRAPWNRDVDIGLVLEGDFEIVTAFWVSPGNGHETLDKALYEQPPVVEELSDNETKVLEGIE